MEKKKHLLTSLDNCGGICEEKGTITLSRGFLTNFVHLDLQMTLQQRSLSYLAVYMLTYLN